jgi:hypothetical protein
MGDWRYSSTILDLGTRWRWVISFITRQLYPRGHNPRYPSDRFQWLSGHCGVEKKSLSLTGNRTPAVQPVARPYTSRATPAPPWYRVGSTVASSAMASNFPLGIWEFAFIFLILEISLDHLCRRDCQATYKEIMFTIISESIRMIE